MDIDAESVFESVKISDLIQKWIKQGYIDKVKGASEEEGITFMWGPRAKTLFPESDMARFMSNVILN